MLLGYIHGLPGWAVAAVVLCTLVTSLIIALGRLCKNLLPQASEDRKEWWKELLDYRRSRYRMRLKDDRLRRSELSDKRDAETLPKASKPAKARR